ncbi:MAG: hypothetical protein NVS4B3_13860 [Gemmatimonadaceae bacterium]
MVGATRHIRTQQEALARWAYRVPNSSSRLDFIAARVGTRSAFPLIQAAAALERKTDIRREEAA